MKCRQLSFYATPEAVDSALATIAGEVIPRFISRPHFIGYVVLQAQTGPGHIESNTRREITVMSFWEDGLEGSESIVQEFIGEVNRVAGTNPTRKSFDLLKAMWRDSAGAELAQFP